jgi:hypothetical protein
MPYVGVIIEESLRDTGVLRAVRITRTSQQPATEWHRTPWVRQWTLHVVEIADDAAERLAGLLADAIDTTHGAWYADFKNPDTHYVVFAGRVFRVRRDAPAAYEEAKAYGRALGIPEYQLDFDTYEAAQV